MNILDPMKPERMYRLDLRRHDHREYAKILAYLAVYEAVRRFVLLYVCMYVRTCSKILFVLVLLQILTMYEARSLNFLRRLF